MSKFYDRAWVSTSTAGQGTITLGAAVTGYFTFAEAGVANGDGVSYCIEDGDDFEYGTGVYTASGTTLTRGTVTKSKISGVAGTTKISLSGNARVFITARSADLLSITETQAANGVFAGPSSGAAAVPAFRAIVPDDFETQLANKLYAGPAAGGVAKPSFRDLVLADIPNALLTIAKMATEARPIMRHLLSVTAANSLTMDFNYVNVPTAFDGTYKHFLMRFQGIKATAADDILYMRIGTGVGPTIQTGVYSWAVTGIVHGTAFATDGSSVDSRIILGSDNTSTKLGNTAQSALNGSMEFASPELAQYNPFNWTVGYIDNILRLCNFTGWGFYNSPTALTALQFSMLSGNNIESGTISLFALDDTP